MKDRRIRAMLGMLALALICLFLGFSIDSASAKGDGARLFEGMRAREVEVVSTIRE